MAPPGATHTHTHTPTHAHIKSIAFKVERLERASFSAQSLSGGREGGMEGGREGGRERKREGGREFFSIANTHWSKLKPLFQNSPRNLQYQHASGVGVIESTQSEV